MPIINATKKTILAEKIEECASFWEQTRGMMFREKVVPLLFIFPKETIVPLHSWFCPGPMDLVFVNDAWEVVELCSEWPKRSGYTAEKKFMYLLELPCGTIAESHTDVGDIVQIERKRGDQDGDRGARRAIEKGLVKRDKR